jgi:hypothetical protein
MIETRRRKLKTIALAMGLLAASSACAKPIHIGYYCNMDGCRSISIVARHPANNTVDVELVRADEKAQCWVSTDLVKHTIKGTFEVVCGKPGYIRDTASGFIDSTPIEEPNPIPAHATEYDAAIWNAVCKAK